MLFRFLGLLLAVSLAGVGCQTPDPDRDNDGSPASKDCDDSSPDTYPGAQEICGDNVDQDCDGFDEPCPPAVTDWDQDGFDGAEYGGDDCNDLRGDVYPGAEEVPYDGIDQDCDGQDLVDVDGDGQDPTNVGGPDCDDSDPTVYTGATDVPYDGVDQDCDGEDLTDVDGDGVDAVVAGGADCDDSNPSVYPGSPEVSGNGVDENCDGVDGVDADGDGFGEGTDCDDTDPEVSPGADEVPCNAVDEDCDGFLEDMDCDGVAGPPVGDDCDDTDSTVYPGAKTETCNSVDEDCDGLMEDEDCDGEFSEAEGGLDCDDQNPNVNTKSVERVSNGVDDDCDGVVDETLAMSDVDFVFGGSGGSLSGASVVLRDITGDGIDDLCIGAPGLLDQSGAQTGGVIIIAGGAGALGDGTLEPSMVVYGEQEHSDFGTALAAGDIDGDGIADLVVSAPDYDGIADQSGKVYFISGPVVPSSGSVASLATGSLEGVSAGGRFGAAVAFAGDVGDDGNQDLLVGAPTVSCVAGDACGAAFFFLDGTAVQAATAEDADFAMYGDEPAQNLGSYLGGLGDLDEDGQGEIAVSSPGASSGEGRVDVLLGRYRENGWPPSTWAALSASPEGQMPARFGTAFGSFDVNGDGASDIFFAAPGGYDGAGVVYLFKGPWGGFGPGEYNLDWASWTHVVGEEPGAALGSVLAGGRLLSADKDDVIMGAPGYGGGVGRLYVFEEQNFDSDSQNVYLGSSVVWRGDDVNAGFASVATAGDIIGNGAGALVVGVPWDSSAAESAGTVLVTLF